MANGTNQQCERKLRKSIRSNGNLTERTKPTTPNDTKDGPATNESRSENFRFAFTLHFLSAFLFPRVTQWLNTAVSQTCHFYDWISNAQAKRNTFGQTSSSTKQDVDDLNIRLHRLYLFCTNPQRYIALTAIVTNWHKSFFFQWGAVNRMLHPSGTLSGEKESNGW